MNVPSCAEALNLWLTAGGQIDQHWQVVIGMSGGAIVLFFSLSAKKRATLAVPATLALCTASVQGALWWTLRRLYALQAEFAELAQRDDVCTSSGFGSVIGVASSDRWHVHFVWAATLVVCFAMWLGRHLATLDRDE